LPVAAGPRRGSLLVHGGGPIEQDAAFQELLLRLAGGPNARLVYIPTAASDDELTGQYRSHLDPASVTRQLGFHHVTIRHTRDPREADSAAFVSALREASAVFLTGGRQWRLADAYLGTRTQLEIENVLRRGGVVAGSSAGATIQGSLLVRGNSDPDDPNILLGDHRQGFGLLRHTAIDQHLLKRHRESDLLTVLKRHPSVLGIGIDEDTCLWVEQDEFTVVGRGGVVVYDGAASPDIISTGRLRSGSKYHLGHRQVLQAVGS
jgi:cyanophycinase